MTSFVSRHKMNDDDGNEFECEKVDENEEEPPSGMTPRRRRSERIRVIEKRGKLRRLRMGRLLRNVRVRTMCKMSPAGAHFRRSWRKQQPGIWAPCGHYHYFLRRQLVLDPPNIRSQVATSTRKPFRTLASLLRLIEFMTFQRHCF